jgi:putative hydrolase of the HAD superfamily
MRTSGSQFDVLLFDVGGVLLTNGWDHNERAAVFTKLGIDRAEFEARHEKPYDAWERDAISAEAYLDAALFYEPRPFTKEEFIEEMKAVSKPIPDNAIDVLGEVASFGNRIVGLLNNESRLLHEYRMEKYGLKPYLDVQLSSCYLGMRKPEPEIYLRAVDILGCAPERVIFIDDRENNFAAAKAVGIHAIRFTGAQQLRQDLKQLEIL